MKAVLWIVVALLVIGGVYYWYTHKNTVPASTSSAAAVTAAQQAAGTPTQVSSLPSGADTSDAALAQDSASVNAQMQSFNSDTAAIDSGMNDKPVSQ